MALITRKFLTNPPYLTLSGREILVKISRVDGAWAWPVQSQEWKVKFFVPLIRSGGGRRVPWRRQCGRYPWASPNLYGSGFSIAVLVDRYIYVPCDFSVRKHAQTRGVRGHVPQENFDFYNLRDCFWWLLRLYTQTKKVNCTYIHL